MMNKKQISDTFYYVETKDKSDRVIRTVVFRLENNFYKAFSSYFPNGNEKIVGFASSNDDNSAISLAIKDLEKELTLEKYKESTH